MKHKLDCLIVILLVIVALFVFSAKQVRAVYDPLSVPNNKIGIHILFPDEINKAKELINSSGGDWGYVTIPIQAGDKDLKKWQIFLDNCAKYHIVPIIRLATEGDYFDKTTWREPKDADVIDFANFLSSLKWPVKNRYIIVFNEVNRGDEWQGQANPAGYAEILTYAVTVFKSKSQDFYILSAGLDNAAATDGVNYNEYDFLEQMDLSVPGIFNQIDGLSSHAYPNPGFSRPPSAKNRESISSFLFELQTVENLSTKKLPVFITETGWNQNLSSDSTVAKYFREALENAWKDPNIVAITPFLLKSGPGPFEKFSFINNDGGKNAIFNMFEALPKTKGTPLLYGTKKILGTSEISQNLPTKDFSNDRTGKTGKIVKTLIKWMFFGL